MVWYMGSLTSFPRVRAGRLCDLFFVVSLSKSVPELCTPIKSKTLLMSVGVRPDYSTYSISKGLPSANIQRFMSLLSLPFALQYRVTPCTSGLLSIHLGVHYGNHSAISDYVSTPRPQPGPQP